MVHPAAQAKQALALALVLAAALAGGCGGGSSASKPATPTTTAAAGKLPAAPAEPPPGSGANPDLGDARLADCASWRKGDVAERYGTIRDISDFAGAAVGGAGIHGATLPDTVAYQVFANWCKNGFATYFKLYKLYTRAAAFRPHTN